MAFNRFLVLIINSLKIYYLLDFYKLELVENTIL